MIDKLKDNKYTKGIAIAILAPTVLVVLAVLQYKIIFFFMKMIIPCGESFGRISCDGAILASGIVVVLTVGAIAVTIGIINDL